MGTSTPPPAPPTFRDLVRPHLRRIRRAAHWAGVRPDDVADVVQEVLFRLHTANEAGRVDTSRSLLGWLLKTTRGVARDWLARAKNRYESLTPPDALEQIANGLDREDRMNEAADVHAIIDRILPKLRPEDREVFIMADLEDTPMEEVIEELSLEKSTAYARLARARAAFAREWKAMQQSRDPALAAFLPLTMEDILAAGHVPPELPPGFMDDVFRRLAERLGPDFAGPPVSSPGGGPGAGAVVGAAAAGAVTLAAWKLALLCLLMLLAGGGLHAVLWPKQAPVQAPAPPATFAVLDPGPATTSAASAGANSAPTSGPAPLEIRPEGSASAAAVHESQEALLDTARQLLRAHDPAKALVVLARVNAPHLTASRDILRQRALAEQAARP